MVNYTEYVINLKTKIIHRVLIQGGARLSDERCQLDDLKETNRMNWDDYDGNTPGSVTAFLERGFRRCRRCWKEIPA